MLIKSSVYQCKFFKIGPVTILTILSLIMSLCKSIIYCKNEKFEFIKTLELSSKWCQCCIDRILTSLYISRGYSRIESCEIIFHLPFSLGIYSSPCAFNIVWNLFINFSLVNPVDECFISILTVIVSLHFFCFLIFFGFLSSNFLHPKRILFLFESFFFFPFCFFNFS